MLEPESGREPENLQRKIHPVRILARPGDRQAVPVSHTDRDEGLSR